MIEIISGTNRPGCNTLKIARVIEGLYREKGVEARILNLQDLPPELFLPAAYGEKPAAFLPFQERILAADGFHVVVPEYNGSFPGVLKYFIDMLKFPESFEQRCVAYTGLAAGLWGDLRGIEQLQMVFNYRNAYNLPQRVWIPAVHKKLTADGQLADADLLALMRDQVQRFAAFVQAHKTEAVHKL